MSPGAAVLTVIGGCEQLAIASVAISARHGVIGRIGEPSARKCSRNGKHWMVLRGPFLRILDLGPPTLPARGRRPCAGRLRVGRKTKRRVWYPTVSRPCGRSRTRLRSYFAVACPPAGA